jgi:DNA-binding MarR family transcriptional regulator
LLNIDGVLEMLLSEVQAENPPHPNPVNGERESSLADSLLVTGERESGPAFDLDSHIFYLLTQVFARRNRDLARSLKPLGVTVAKWRVLAVLGDRDGATMSQLAELSSIDRTTLTRTLDQMVRDGLVERRAGPSDRRIVHLHLTGSGRDLLAAVLPIVMTQNQRAIGGVGANDLAMLRGTLRRMIENLDGDP